MANPASHPEGGVDYPRTLTEFDAWFVSETACAEFLGGFVKLTGFTPKSRYIVDGSSTQIQWLSLMEKCRKQPTFN